MRPIISGESLFISSGEALNKQFPLVLYLFKVGEELSAQICSLWGVFIAVLVWVSRCFFLYAPPKQVIAHDLI